MALTDKDLERIAEMMEERIVAAQVHGRGASAEDILPLIQNPNVRIYPGPTRSRYSQVTLLDKDDRPQRQLRVRTSDIRTILLNAFNDEPGLAIADGKVPEIVGPKER